MTRARDIHAPSVNRITRLTSSRYRSGMAEVTSETKYGRYLMDSNRPTSGQHFLESEYQNAITSADATSQFDVRCRCASQSTVSSTFDDGF